MDDVRQTKRVGRDVFASFSAVLLRWVNDCFGGNQTHAAKVLGCTQSHISAMLSGKRGPGLNTLLLLHERTGISVDVMLGLAAPEPAALPSPESLSRAEMLQILDAELARRGLRPGAVAPTRRRRLK